MIEHGKSTFTLKLLQGRQRAIAERSQTQPNQAERMGRSQTNLEVADEDLVAQRLFG